MAVAIVLYVIVEVAAIWAVSSTIGVLATVGLLVAGALLGSWLTRQQGSKAFGALMTAARNGQPGHAELGDGVLIALGGVLFALPGFVTDVAGLLVLLPPTRKLLRHRWLKRLEQRADQPKRGMTVDGIVVDGDVAEPKPTTTPRIIEP